MDMPEGIVLEGLLSRLNAGWATTEVLEGVVLDELLSPTRDTTFAMTATELLSDAIGAIGPRGDTKAAMLDVTEQLRAESARRARGPRGVTGATCATHALTA